MEPQQEPTTEEQTPSIERLEEEEAQRYPGHDDPEQTINPDPDAA